LRKKDRNLSTELYFVMSSNKKGMAYDNKERSASQFEGSAGGERLMGASKTVIGGFGAR